jgi:tetratricopeptide (TPR) repeat protein
VYGQTHHAAAQTLLGQSIALLEDGGDPVLLAQALATQGYAALGTGEYTLMAESFTRALDIFRQSGDRWGEGLTLNGLAMATLFGGNAEEAWQMLKQAEAMLRAVDTPVDLAITLNVLAMIANGQGEYALEKQLLRESLGLVALVRDRSTVAYTLTSLAGSAVVQGQYVHGVRLFGAAEALREATGEQMHFAASRTRYAQQVAMARANLDAPTFAEAWAAGRGTPLEQVVAYALNESALM